MKIFTASQIHELDQYTIANEPVKSIDLMERAARAMTTAIQQRWDNRTPVVVFAGPGNNGGDALAVARMLLESQYQVQTFIFNVNGKLSPDCHQNLKRLREKWGRTVVEVIQEFDPPQLTFDMLVIDGLFGSGLNKPLAGGFSSLVRYINASDAKVVSLDVPSGLMTEDNTYNVRTNIIRATLTLTLQQPKLSMLFAENQEFIGELSVLDIHLSQKGMDEIDAQYTLIEEAQVRSRMKKRSAFAHKGDMGNALLVAGSYGMAGAAVLAARACLRAGVGKLTIVTPRLNVNILQSSVPEAVLKIDREETIFCEAVSLETFQAMGIGLHESHTLAVGDSIVVWKNVESFSGTPALETDVIDAGKHLYWDDTDLSRGILHVTDTPTGIRHISGQTTQEDAWYTLDGRRLNGRPTTKGIYVRGGKTIGIGF